MEEQSKYFDEVTRKLVHEAGLEKPSLDFTRQVLKEIEEKPVVQIANKPLISVWGWTVFATIFIGAITILYFYPPNEIAGLNEFIAKETSTIKNPFAGMEIPKTFIYGIGFLALFLIQIPFLKRQLNKQFSV